jgi:predicted RNA-binding protein YlxR (DUF448 family)
VTDKGELVRIARAAAATVPAAAIDSEMGMDGARPAAGAAPAVVIDHEMRMDGRGAYLCAGRKGVPAGACLERALQRGAIVRALRCAANVDCSDLLESVGQ